MSGYSRIALSGEAFTPRAPTPDRERSADLAERRAVIGTSLRRGRWADHPYVAVGNGPRTLLVIPGLNDPLCRVTDRWWFGLLAAAFCRRFVGTHTVAMVSRPPGLDEGTTMRELADGYAEILEGTGPADVIGLSMGGFLVMELAIDRPDLVEHAVLGLAAARLSAHGRELVERWRGCASEEHWRPIRTEAADAVAGGLWAPLARGAADLYGRFGSPSRVDRRDFLTSAEACLAYDATDRLGEIAVPSLVIGGTEDPFFSPEAFRETAAGIPDARFAEIEGAGHEAVLDRRREFDGAIDEFLYE